MMYKVHTTCAAVAVGLAVWLAAAGPAQLAAQQITAEPPAPSAESLAGRRVVLIEHTRHDTSEAAAAALPPLAAARPDP